MGNRILENLVTKDNVTDYYLDDPDPQGGGSSYSANKLKWEDMLKNYPNTSIRTKDLYDEIGGGLPELFLSNPNSWENSCAIRMSRALNYSGVKLKKAPSSGGNIKGDDGFNYWIRVKDLQKFLIDFLPKPSLDKVGGLGAVNDFIGKKGIVVFDVSGWGNATGHFTLWDGGHLVYPGAPEHDDPTSEYYYFHMKYVQNSKTIKTTRIRLWDLN
jgi:hypothetical protein